MKLKNKILLLFCSLFVLLMINGTVDPVIGHKEQITSGPAEQILQTIILQGEGIVRPVFSVREITANAFRIPSSFYKANLPAFASKALCSSFFIKNTGQKAARTFSVSLQIIFRVLLI